MHGVWGASASDVWTAGVIYVGYPDFGNGLHWDGNRWSSVELLSDGGLGGSSVNDVWGVGSGGIGHWDGMRWSHVPFETTAQFQAVWSSSASDVWFFGAGGAILRRQP